MHNAGMGVMIQVRDVDEDVRDALKARAAARGQSLNSYLKQLLSETARHPSRAEVFGRISRRVETSTVSSVDVIRTARDER